MTSSTTQCLRLTTCLVFAVGGMMTAHAASLGGINGGSLSAWTYAADIDVGPVACASFDLPGGNLAGQPVGCGGGTWSTSGGNWHIVNGQAMANAQTSIASVAGPSPFMSASVDVIDADKKNREGGVVVSFDASTGFHLAAVIVGPGLVELRQVGASTVVLGSKSIPIGSTTRLSLTRTSTTATVSVDGVPVITLPFASGELLGTGAGLYHGGGPPVSFDNFQADHV